MEIKEGYYYTKEHEWISIDGGTAKVGITDYAQHKLGDITFVEPVEEGIAVNKSDVITGVESVKAASDVYSPVDGKVASFNDALNDAPELINNSPYEKGWIVEMEVSGPKAAEGLMDSRAYGEYTGGLE